MTALHRATLATLSAPEYSANILAAAGISRPEAEAKGRLFAFATMKLMERGHSGGENATATYVPGRVEVLGKHTDYCGGRSILCTVERGMCFVAVPREDPTVEFFAINLGETAQIKIDSELQPNKKHWSNYLMTVVRRIAQNFPHSRRGADIAMSSDLPAASGLSSSSAMVIGCFLTLSEINQLARNGEYLQHIRSRQDLADFLGCVENGQSFGRLQGDKGVGTFGGSQDHTAILCCVPGAVSVYSFRPVVHECDIALSDEMRFVIADSGVVAEKTGDAMEKYNLVANRAQKILDLWNATMANRATCLRDVAAAPASELRTFKRHLEELDVSDGRLKLQARLEQFEEESGHLIPRAVQAIRNFDWNAFRLIADESQHRAVRELENQVAQTVELQRVCLCSGAVAASAFGAGFGGSVWALFHRDSLQTIESSQTVGRFRAFVTRPGCAATTIATIS